MIPQDIIQNIIDQANIVDVIKPHVTLTKKGVNHVGACPFHNEKTASFVVSPNKGIFKCFGCGKSGNSIGFLMDYKQIGYVDAVKSLAHDLGIVIPQRERSQEEIKKDDLKEEIFKANLWALKFFQKQLEANEQASNYLEERFPNKVPANDGRLLPKNHSSVCAEFQLGYSGTTSPGTSFISSATAAGFSLPTLLAAGLIKKKDERYYDTFINRLMFPILNTSGRVTGFTGRIIEAESKYSKYLNTEETLVFNKSNTLYGINLAYRKIKETGLAYLVEGNTDVMRMHEAGFSNTIAGMGTAFTLEHAKQLARYAKRVLIVMDGDNAGQKAMMKAGEILLKEGLFVSLLLLEEGVDPDDHFKNYDERKKDVDKYNKDHTVDYVLYYTEKIYTDAGLDTGLKIEAKQNVANLLLLINDQVRRDGYMDELESVLKKFKVTKASLKALVKPQSEDETVVMELDSDSLPSYLSPAEMKDAFKYGIYEGKEGKEVNQYFLTLNKGSRAPISTFVMQPIFHLRDVTNPTKLFELKNKYGFSVKIELDMQEMTSLASFKKVVEGQGNFVFMGTDSDFQKLRIKLYDRTKFCDPVKNLGWQPQGFWAWANGIQVGDIFIEVDENGIVEHEETSYFIPAMSDIYCKDKTLFANERKFKLSNPTTTILEWSELFVKVYGDNGMVGIAFWVASVFRDHLISFYNNFPLLNMFGPKGTGKSQMALALSHLYGEPQPFFNIHNGTQAALAEHLSLFRNGLAWIEEYKNSIEFQKIENLKQIYDNQGRTRMVMGDTKRKGKETTPINSGAMITGQEMPTADIALFSRVIFLMFVKSEYTIEERELYNELTTMQKKGLSNLTNEMVKHRTHFEKEYFYQYHEVLANISEKLKDTGTERIYRNWASIVAAWKTIAQKVKFSFSYEQLLKISIAGIERQERQIGSSDELGKFWALLESLFDQDILIDGWDFKIELENEIITKSRTIKLVPAKRVLKFKFNTVTKHYMEHSRKMGEKPLPTDSLRVYLEASKAYIGVSKTETFRKVEHSQEQGRNTEEKVRTTAYCFDYERLGISMERDVEAFRYPSDSSPAPYETSFEELPEIQPNQSNLGF